MNHPRDSKWFRDAPTNGLADSVKTIEEIIQEIKEDAANSTNPAHVSKVLPAEVSQVCIPRCLLHQHSYNIRAPP
jgi:hypothetical protein